MDDYNPRTRYEHYYVRMARLEGRGELQKRYPDDFYVRPFQIAGNVYYIGNKAVCSHLIDTGEGLIVIDTSYPELDHLLINSGRQALTQRISGSCCTRTFITTTLVPRTP